MSHFEDTDILITPKEFLDAWINSEQHRLNLEETIEGLNRPSKDLFVKYEIATKQSQQIAFEYWLKFNRHIYDEFYNQLETNVQNRKLVDFLNQKN